MKTICIFLLALFMSGCTGSPAWRGMRINATESEAKINNEKIMKVNIGQSRKEVLEIMGQPAKREVYQLENQRLVEFLFYRTGGWSVNAPEDRDYQFTPFAFENNSLIGWGRNFYDNVVRASVEIRMKK